MERVYNFAAGPAVMPEEVLQKIKSELTNYGQSGMSVMELSHRTKIYEDIINGAQASLRELMRIPDDYAVLFLQGGASMQFSQVAMNLAKRGQRADYVLTGQFATKAYEEGLRWCDAKAIASSKDKNFSYIPKISPDMVGKDSAYLHITANNTIYGTMYNDLPKTDVPLVCDMSSVILGKEYDINRFALVYAGAQKNMGPAGLTVVIIRRDMINQSLDSIVPTMLNYSVMEKNGSMYNTPPTFAIYVAGLVYKWVLAQGGVAALEERNRQKAKLLYDTIDNSKAFSCPTAAEDRSIMNVPFVLADEAKTAEFLEGAAKRGLVNLKGHRAVGGCRASIYNAMPQEGVMALCDYMKEFERGI